MIKISIIVPVYNAATYLSECVESILLQTYKNFEVILVDDGSSDNSGQICDNFSIKDSRVKVIHQDNRGRSFARNSGIDKSTGDYLYFVDADDIIDPNLLELVVNALKEHDVDCVRFGYKKFNSTGQLYSRKLHEKLYIFDQDDMKIQFAQSLLNGDVYFQVWSGVFKRSIIFKNNIRFCDSDKIFSEDSLFSVLFSLYSSSSYSIPFEPYNYREVSTSIMNEARKEKRILINEFIEWSKKLVELSPNSYLKDNAYLISHYIYLIAIPHRLKDRHDTIQVVNSIIDKVYFKAQSRLFYKKTRLKIKKEFGLIEGWKQNIFNSYFSDLISWKFKINCFFFLLITTFIKPRVTK